MTDEYKIDGTTWAEKDSNGNLIIKNLRDANFDGNLIIESDGSGNVDLKNLSSLTTDDASITNLVGAASLTTNQTITSGITTQVNLDQKDIEDDASGTVDVDLTNNKLIIQSSGTYYIVGSVAYAASSNWSAGDLMQVRLKVGTNAVSVHGYGHSGQNQVEAPPEVSHVVNIPSPPTDVILNTLHTRGGDESVNGVASNTYLHVMRLG